jgi:hypothetical protein
MPRAWSGPMAMNGQIFMRQLVNNEGFHPFSSGELFDESEDFWRWSEPRYAVVVHFRSKLWNLWRPDSVEDVPPTLGHHGLYSVCDGFGEALSKTRRLNAETLGTDSGTTPDQWAIVVCIDHATPQESALLRIVTPIEYRCWQIRIPAPWVPKHLLDVPLSPFKDKHLLGSDLPARSTLENAMQEVIRLNRAASGGRQIPVTSWHVVIGLESQSLSETREYRCWKPSHGVMSLESSKRFHVFDKSSWPIAHGIDDEALQMQLPPSVRRRLL